MSWGGIWSLHVRWVGVDFMKEEWEWFHFCRTYPSFFFFFVFSWPSRAVQLPLQLSIMWSQPNLYFRSQRFFEINSNRFEWKKRSRKYWVTSEGRFPEACLPWALAWAGIIISLASLVDGQSKGNIWLWSFVVFSTSKTWTPNCVDKRIRLTTALSIEGYITQKKVYEIFVISKITVIFLWFFWAFFFIFLWFFFVFFF